MSGAGRFRDRRPSPKVGGKVFAGDWNGELVVKLPAERVEALIAAGEGALFAPMEGRVMKEWVVVLDDALAREALDFVRGS